LFILHGIFLQYGGLFVWLILTLILVAKSERVFILSLNMAGLKREN